MISRRGLVPLVGLLFAPVAAVAATVETDRERRQRELLEDIITYRMARSPDRRVFYIDTNHPPERVRQIVGDVKRDFDTRRIV